MYEQNSIECELCGVKITYKNWARHLKSKAHLKKILIKLLSPEKTCKWCYT